MNESEDRDQLTQYWRNHIDTWKASKESGASYCKRNELIYHRFNYWHRKFGDSRAQKTLVSAQSKGFTQVVMGRSELPGGLTLSLPNGLMIGDISEANVTVVRKLLAFL
jgi:hypothetical protein